VWCDTLELHTVIYPSWYFRVVVLSDDVDPEWSLSKSLSRAFLKGRNRTFIYIVLDFIQLVVVLLCRWDVDTSMFIRTVASPETLNG
jgi:hypothetical protein